MVLPRAVWSRRETDGLALTRPVVIELADAHWIDSSTLELFDRVVSSIAAKQIFVLVSCQSAPNRDPLSASKRDPFERRVRAVALAPSELVGVAETARARVVG